MYKLFYNVYNIVVGRKLLGLAGLITIAFGLAFVASKIRFEEDITKLIPSNGKTSQVQKVLKQINFADKVIVNIKRHPNGSIDDLTQYASQFIDSITNSSNDYISKIQGKVEDDDLFNTMDFVYNNLPLFLNKIDYQSIEGKISKDSISAITNQNYKTLISPSGFVAKKTILKDPLGLSFLGLKKFQELSFGDSFTLHNGFLVSKEKNNLLLFITPKLKSSETDKNTEFVKNLYQVNEALNKDFLDKVESEYFGGLLIAVANANQIKSDIQLTISIAITILLLILIVFYRKFSIPIILFIPTVLGGLLAIAVLFLIRTKISAISLGIGSVLLGVTLDYSLHILTHIRSNNNIKKLYKEITKPILMSSITTALAFLCLLFLQSQALQDLGVFAAISVVSASCFALVFIPQVYTKGVKKNAKSTIIDRVSRYNLHNNKWAIIFLAVGLLVSLFTYNKVSFNKDLNKLNYQPQELKEAQSRLDALTNMSSKSLYLAAYGNTVEDALRANDAVFPLLEDLKKKDQVLEFSSIGSLIQSEDIQNQKISQWQFFWTPERVNKIKDELIESGDTLGFKSNTFNRFYELLNTDFNPLKVDDYKLLKTISVEDYITSSDDFTTVTTLVKVKDEHIQGVVDTFDEFPQTVVIDRKHMNETLLGNLKNDFNRLVLYSAIIVFLILLIFYRSFSLTLVTSIPIALTWILTIGVMGLFNIEFNIFNIIISSFIFGLGIDYCIFITNGLLHQYRTGERVVSTHKTSIVLSVITTVLGVGVLIFAKHPALYSISLVSIIGILSALMVSFIIQPLLFKLFIGSTTKRPITFRLLIHSVISFGYYGIGGFLLSMFSVTIMRIIPLSKKNKMSWFHRVLSKFMRSVLYTNPFVVKKVINDSNEEFKKQAVIIANHTSFLDILAIGMLHPKIIFLVNDWVYNSPVFGKAVKLAGFYPVSSGIENGVSHLQKKVDQGYSLMAFPEGTRSYTNKPKRFHKGAFYLAEQFNLDILPVIIHGNSEVLPKGSFVIKNGSITVKILDRILASDESFGTTFKERTKQISNHFKREFKAFRNEFEHDTYFHNVILEDYRYKGDAIFKAVKQDLKNNKENYKNIIDIVDDDARILHLSNDYGQLDFLMALDGPSRKINTFIKDKTIRRIVANSYITNAPYKIEILDDLNSVDESRINVLILNTDELIETKLLSVFEQLELIILLEESKNVYSQLIGFTKFRTHIEKDNFIILITKNQHED